MNFGAQFKWATSRQAHIVKSRGGSIVVWIGLEERAKDRFWTAWKHKLRRDGESDGRRTKTGFGNHGEYSCLSSSKDNRGSARQSAESTHRVTGRFRRAVGRTDHEED